MTDLPFTRITGCSSKGGEMTTCLLASFRRTHSSKVSVMRSSLKLVAEKPDEAVESIPGARLSRGPPSGGSGFAQSQNIIMTSIFIKKRKFIFLLSNIFDIVWCICNQILPKLFHRILLLLTSY